jgi:hypothetical protein
MAAAVLSQAPAGAGRTTSGRETSPFFPPNIVVEVKAIACQLPCERNLPLSRLSYSEIRREVIKQAIVASISEATLWRWLSQDAIQPWRFRTWLFPRDVDFVNKAGRVLDLYARIWDGAPLNADDFVLSADEKTSIQARQPKHSGTPPQPHQPMRLQADYKRLGAWVYLAAWMSIAPESSDGVKRPTAAAHSAASWIRSSKHRQSDQILNSKSAGF